MTPVQVATRIDSADRDKFLAISDSFGLTPADSLRVFIKKFNEEGGFPFSVNRGYDSVVYEPDFVNMVLEADAGTDWSARKPYKNAKESFDDILGVGWDA